MIDNLEVGTEIRVTTDKWESAGFGPEQGEIGTVTTSVFTGVDELPVLFSDGVYFVKPGEFETLEDAAFQPGDRVRVVSSPDPLVEVGREGTVLDLDDPKLFMAWLFVGEPPADLNIVDFEEGFIGLRNHELELIEEDEVTGLLDALFPPVVPQPEADLAEWEQKLLAAEPVQLEAPRLLTGDFVAFELLNAGHFGGTEVQLLHCGGGYYNLAITSGYNRVAPSLTAAERRLLGQALIESAEIGE